MPGKSSGNYPTRTFKITIAVPRSFMQLCSGACRDWQLECIASGQPNVKFVITRGELISGGDTETVIVLTGDFAPSPAPVKALAEEDVLNSLADYLLKRLGAQSAHIEYGIYAWDRSLTPDPADVPANGETDGSWDQADATGLATSGAVPATG